MMQCRGNKATMDGITSLFFAVQNGNLELASLLLTLMQMSTMQGLMMEQHLSILQLGMTT